MRKLLVLLAALALVGGVASAQSYWAGFSVGTGGALHVGIEDVAPNLDIRANVGYNYVFGVGLAFGVDALYGLDVDTGDVPIDVYLGGGIALGAYPAGFTAGIGALVGGEYSLVDVGLPEGGVFFELGPVVNFVPGVGFGGVGRLGFNYHF